MKTHPSPRFVLPAVLFVLTGLAAHAATFTLEQVLSSPFPYGLTAASHAPRIAWVFDFKGARNVWVADGPNFAARQVTHFSGDDGTPIASLRLTRRIALMRYPFPPAETVEFFRQYYGPTRRAFASLDASAQAALRRELVELQTANNIATTADTTEVAAEYLEVVAVRSV